MQAIILATDEERRTPPLTDLMPAPMLPIIDRPVMATTIEILARAGHKQLLMSLYERGSQITAHFGSGRRWGVEITYVTQRQGWGTAGALRWASGLLSETFLVLRGDDVCDLDIEAALRFHRAHGGVATAILHPPRAGALALTAHIGGDNRLLGLGAASDSSEGLQCTGAFIFEPGMLHYIPPARYFEITTDLLPSLITGGERVYGYTMEGYWNPLNSLADYREAQEVFLYSAFYQQAPEHASGGPGECVRFPSLEARPVATGIWVGRGHSIHPTVKLAAPVYIGCNNWIGREVELGSGTILGENVVIDDEATISHSTVLSNTYVGRLVDVDHKIITVDSISDPTTGETTSVVDPFLVSRVGGRSASRNPVRRILSIAVTIGLIILASPLLLLIGMVILITARGQVLTREQRVGQRASGVSGGLHRFDLINFQTRRANGSYLPGGRLLERWELQRLPELFNVLGGDMGLIGVKPLRPEEVSGLTEEWHQRRHEAPAGLTGLWYLQTSSESDLDTVIVTDVYYTATRNWRGDMLILLRTPGAWLRRLRSERGDAYLVQADNVTGM